MQINGIGPITPTALVASVGGARVFINGRQLAAWLGLTPRQYSSGGITRLGRITKRGDRYLRMLLAHGARALLRFVNRKTDARSVWAKTLKERRHVNIAAVAWRPNTRGSSGQCWPEAPSIVSPWNWPQPLRQASSDSSEDTNQDCMSNKELDGSRSDRRRKNLIPRTGLDTE
jgi:Transposase IS116/IS110/IS902 family